jgi:hypothetical protein
MRGNGRTDALRDVLFFAGAQFMTADYRRRDGALA